MSAVTTWAIFTGAACSFDSPENPVAKVLTGSGVRPQLRRFSATQRYDLPLQELRQERIEQRQARSHLQHWVGGETVGGSGVNGRLRQHRSRINARVYQMQGHSAQIVSVLDQRPVCAMHAAVAGSSSGMQVNELGRNGGQYFRG